jgi:uncharacterized protein
MIDKNSLPSLDKIKDILSNSLCKMFLTITDQCNLRCAYCPYIGNENYHSIRNSTLSIPQIENAVKFFLDRSSETENPVINLFGGEPFLDFGKLKKTVEIARRLSRGKELVFSVTTNGTIMEPDWIPWLVENNVSLRISLGGDQAHNDKNRKFTDGEGSFSRIRKTLSMVKEYNESYASRFVSIRFVEASREHRASNLGMLESDSALFDSFEIAATLTTECGCYERLDNEYAVFNQDSPDYHYWSRYLGDGEPLSEASSKYITSLISDIRHVKGYFNNLDQDGYIMPGGMCIPGHPAIHVDTEGNIFPCFLVEPFGRIGTIEDGFDFQRIYSLFEQYIHVMTAGGLECETCPVRGACTICWLSAFDKTGNFDMNNLAKVCKSFRYQAEHFMNLAIKMRLLKPDLYERIPMPTQHAGFRSNCF